ncbi:MAG TPA: UDP-N-acetylmuramoyl-tripeptide--D-alanyl-D-alanine ligase [Candidatus Paceibacterota bacterium]|nr:UDP-N-acetylmuramoyl-tripeptide--D-alanyl-D-alanine ligase [Candidatus Paceibacterota bacterium]
MDSRPLTFLVSACGGELRGGSPDAAVQRVCTDSRQVRAGDVFFALAGERFDGHEFVAEAAARGAVAVVVNRGRPVPAPGGCALVAVEDTRRALGQLAARYRQDFQIPAIAVGGSNGKTTTKDLIAAVLGQRLRVVSSEASFNNDIGVPLTLLRIESGHEAAVLEVGTNHPGELAPLVRMIQPTLGVITSLGREHLEFFGDLAGVVREEGVLAEMLPESGKLFINGDSEWAREVIGRCRATVVRTGFAGANDWRVRAARLDRQGLTFRVEAPEAAFAGEYRISLLGRHQAANALFAIALGAEFGLSRAEIERGLAECRPARMRLQFWEHNGIRVLDDAYNANADSMLAALRTLREFPCRGRRVAVLGDMAELGAHSETAHEEVGRYAAEAGVGQLFAVGRMAAALARGARAAGLTRVFEFAEVEAAGAAVKSFVREGDLLLIKASRATRLERIAQLLRGPEAARKN